MKPSEQPLTVPRHGHPIARFAVLRPVTTTMLVLGIVVIGLVSLKRIPLEFLPSFSSSNITVEGSYPSSSPEEVRRLIVQPLEDSLGTIAGIDTLSSTASGSSGRVRLSFVDGTDMDMAAVEVRDRIERVRDRLPDDLDRLWVRRFQSTDIPVVSFHLTSNWDRARLFYFAENVLQRRLERLEGVAQVSINGLQTPAVQVDLDPARLQAHGVDVTTLTSLIRGDNRNQVGGTIDTSGQRLTVRSMGEFRTLEELAQMPIDARGLVLSDVADVSYGTPRQESFNFLNGGEALTVSINKSSNANLLAVVDGVKAEMEALAAEPETEGLTWRIYRDASVDVRQGLAQLRNAGLIGGGLAILTVFFFLRRFRTTALVAVAVPVSVVATFALLFFLRQVGWSDITLNVVSLAGLMLALGMLVDNSIVVIESIFRQRNDLGKDAQRAAIDGAGEVALPIIASTITTLCVFLPIVFMGTGGRTQIYFSNIALTVSVVIAASLFVALTVVPMSAALFLRRQEGRAEAMGGLKRFYGRVLEVTLHHRLVFVILLLLLLGGSVYLFQSIERSFTQSTEERSVTVYVDTGRQFSLDQKQALYEQVYTLLQERRDELDIQDITYGYDRGNGRAQGRSGRRIEIFLKDEAESQWTTAEAREKVRALLPVVAGANLRIAQARGPASSSGIEVELVGEDPSVLRLLSGQLLKTLAQVPGIRDLDTSLDSGDEEIRVSIEDDRAVERGLSTRRIASTISSSLSSRAVSQMKTADREVDIIVQYAEGERETLGQLSEMSVPTPGGAQPLGAIVGFERTTGAQQIEREDHLSKVTVTGNTSDPRATFLAMQSVGEVMESFDMPPGYEWRFGRFNRFQQEEGDSTNFAMIFAVVLIYLLMAALFESFIQPLIIMLSVPFALFGVALAMKLTGQAMESMATIGVIILLGIVVNNAIVLIDHINQLRREGLPRDEAILRGGQNRLRPILITAVTTILGLTPLVMPILLPQWFGPIEGRAGIWAPIGLVIMGGLTTSTFLTLLIIPTIYSLIDDLARFAQRVVRTA
ncbi:MAG: efflux RND transporter permease subunit [Thermoanaerobaculia bacterium]|nr:efflux RND transporter permease subunit [Thermoanaerobaculia bacterium]